MFRMSAETASAARYTDLHDKMELRLWLSFSVTPGLADFVIATLAGEATNVAVDEPTRCRQSQWAERLATTSEPERVLLLDIAEAFIGQQQQADSQFSQADFPL